MNMYIQLVLCLFAVGHVLADECEDNETFRVRATIRVSCDGLQSILTSRKIQQLCKTNKDNTMDYCCSVCQAVNVNPEEGGICGDDSSQYSTEVEARLLCPVYADSDPEGMKEACEEGRSEIHTKCCATCEQLMMTTAMPTPPPPMPTTTTMAPLGPDEEMINGQCIKKVAGHGGWGGIPFNDQGYYFNNERIEQVVVRHGWFIDCFGFVYGGREVCHGGLLGGTKVVVPLHPGEYVRGIHGRADIIVHQLSILTNMRTIGHYGGGGGFPFAIPDQDRKLAYISGGSGLLLDSLVQYYEC